MRDGIRIRAVAATAMFMWLRLACDTALSVNQGFAELAQISGEKYF